MEINGKGFSLFPFQPELIEAAILGTPKCCLGGWVTLFLSHIHSSINYFNGPLLNVDDRYCDRDMEMSNSHKCTWRNLKLLEVLSHQPNKYPTTQGQMCKVLMKARRKSSWLVGGESQPVGEGNLSQFLKGRVIWATSWRRHTISTNRHGMKEHHDKKQNLNKDLRWEKDWVIRVGDHLLWLWSDSAKSGMKLERWNRAERLSSLKISPRKFDG